MDTSLPLDQALRATGELLARRGQSADDVSPASRADELDAARAWISQTQDPSPAMAAALEKITTHVLAADR